ncbi:hypothetical protein ACI8AV_18085 [Geodermatophilus sp. SYSU D00804]
MWLLTPTGFYSAVATGDGDVLAVRTRTLGDARQLVDRVFADGDYSRVITRPHADYRHRVLLTGEQWTDFVADEAAHIDYGNFKQAVAERQGSARAAVYAEVWASLYRLQTERSQAR